jgi:hypothetical protein
MRTQVFRTVVLGGVAGATFLLALGSAVQAQAPATVAGDRTAGYVLFPSVVSDPQDAFNQDQETETLIQLTNTHNEEITVHCFYVNATGRCLNGENALGFGVPGEPLTACRSNADCLTGNGPGICDTSTWDETNFTLVLSPEQPTGWLASEGRRIEIVVTDPNDPNGVEGEGFGLVLPVPTEYFQGELKCIEVNDVDNAIPVNANHLKGEATTYVVTTNPIDPNDVEVDVRRYNAIGIQAVSNDGQPQNDQTLCLGGNNIPGNVCQTGEYAACPERLILNHLFDGALPGELDADPSITLVPCTQRIAEDEPTSLTIQMLVFNEFEQRFSLSTQLECYRDINLRDLSVLFAIGTQGTVAGQTVFRAVGNGDRTVGGFGILGVAEMDTIGGSTAYNVVYSGMHANTADFVTYVFPDTEGAGGD